MIYQLYFNGELIRDFGNKSKLAWDCCQFARDLIFKLTDSDPVVTRSLIMYCIPED